MKKIPNPSDRYFRAAMKDLRVATDFFKTHLPQFIRDQINFKTLSLKDESFVDKRLRQYWVDILYGVQINSKQGYLYLLTEHQSTAQRFMAFRLLNYTVRIMERHVAEKERDELPIVFPLVFYNGLKRYNQPRDIFKLFGDQEELAREVMFKPFQLVDLTRVDDEELRQRQWSGVMEFVMKHIHARDFNSYCRELTWMLKTISAKHADMYIYATIAYIVERAGIENYDEFDRMIADGLSPSVGGRAMTLKELFLQEGRQAGRQEGRRETQREMILNMAGQGADLDFIAGVSGLPLDEVKVITKDAKVKV